jgi:hypothetical protein
VFIENMNKEYTIFPNFCFQVEAENEVEANSKAYDLLKEMRDKVGYFDFDFTIEENK